MDAFSQIIDLAHIRGSLDLRCQLAGRFALDHDTTAPGEAPFHLVLNGHASMQLPNGDRVTLAPGDFVLLPRGSSHLVSNAGGDTISAPMIIDHDGPLKVRRNTDGDAELDLLCGRFNYLPGSGDLVMGALPDVLHLSLAETRGMDALHGVVSLLRAEVTQLQPGALTIVTALSQVLFVLVLRAYALRENMPPSLLALLGDPRLSRTVLQMLRHPERDWTVATLAAQAMMSRATFARHFAARGATSPLELLTVLRMQTARDLLMQGLTTADVAERVGYQSEAAFGKVFAQRIGCTPAAFRRHHRAIAKV